MLWWASASVQYQDLVPCGWGTQYEGHTTASAESLILCMGSPTVNVVYGNIVHVQSNSTVSWAAQKQKLYLGLGVVWDIHHHLPYLFLLSERGATRTISSVFNFSFILLVLVMTPWESGSTSLTAQTIIVSAFTTPWSFLHLRDGKLMQSQLSGKCGTLDTYCNLSGWHCAMNIKEPHPLKGKLYQLQWSCVTL